MEINTESVIKGEFSDTLTIASRTVRDDIAQTSYLTRYPFGFLKDPVFGSTEVRLAMTVGIPSTDYSFGDSARLDSAVLVLKYAGEFYGDSTLSYTINVHQLSTNLSDIDAFPSNKEYPYENQIIGSRTGRLFPTTKIKVLDIVAGAADTFKNEEPQLRIRLDQAFIADNIVGLPATSLKSAIAFENAFKGLHVQVNKTNVTGKGAMMFFDLANAGSYVSLYYKKKGTTTTDTVNALFPIGNNVYPAAATIKQDYTGTVIESQLNQPGKQFQETYLQPLTGLRNRIAFPYIDKFKEKAGKIVVNKAELVIDVAAGTDLSPFDAAPRLSLYRYDIAEQRANLPDNSPTTDPRGFQDSRIFGGYFNAVTRQYVFVITSYIQDLVSGKTKDYGTFLAPIPSSEFLVTPSLGSAARAVISAQKKNPAAGEGTMKLNIYYTKVE